MKQKPIVFTELYHEDVNAYEVKSDFFPLKTVRKEHTKRITRFEYPIFTQSNKIISINTNFSKC